MGKNHRITSESARRWMGRPVCVVLKDGSCCVGWITDVDQQEITLSSRKAGGEPKAKVSGYIPGMFNGIFGPGEWDFNPMELYGGPMAAQAAPAVPAGGDAGAGSGFGTGFGNFMGFMRKTWPDIKFGIGMVQQIMPFMKGLQL